MTTSLSRTHITWLIIAPISTFLFPYICYKIIPAPCQWLPLNLSHISAFCQTQSDMQAIPTSNHWSIRYILLLSCILFGRGFNSPVTADVVDLGYAKYLGNRTYPNTLAYLGIPYGKPPVGALRFRAPVPVDTTDRGDDIMDARTYPLNCIQGAGVPIELGTEDCLKLNVYVPAGAKEGDQLPVLFYIHGGGYIFGDPNTWPFDHWINQSPDIIIVSIYYRLSSFGFLSSPLFNTHTQLNEDFNPGFLDQIAALNWTHSHIHKFGGSNKKVTIMGQSAGASSVELHLVANYPRKTNARLFRAAIAQSVYRITTPYPDQTADAFKIFVDAAGCGMYDNLENKMDCLRGADVTTVVEAQNAAGGFTPVIDGTIITDSPTKLILDGQFDDVPLLIGAATNETLARGDDIPRALKSYFKYNYTEDDAKDLLQAYEGVNFESETLKSQTIGGDASVRCSRTIMGSRFNKTWAYRFNQASPLSSEEGLVRHSDDNYFLFKGSDGSKGGITTFHPLTPLEESFAEEMIAYYVSFVRSGNPNTFKLGRSPRWGLYDKIKRRRMVFQQGGNSTSEFEVEQEEDWEIKGCEANAAQVDKQQN